MQIASVGDEAFVTGWHLAGVGRSHIATKENASRLFEELLADRELAVVITNTDIMAMLSERVREKAVTHVKPIVVALSKGEGDDQSLRLLIRRALGIDLWANENSGKSQQDNNSSKK